MLKNYVKIAIRNISKNKGYSFINIFGLAVGITCCLLIFLFVQYELSFDNFHSKTDCIYRVTSYTEYPEGTEDIGATPYPFAAALRNDFPELEQVSQIYYEGTAQITIADKKFKEKGVVFADPHLFKIFDYNWISGNPEKALNDPNSVVLTESMALKYFGNVPAAIGKSINMKNTLDLKVFTLIAILICCLGLLGLISFMVSQKTREISIRKVLGASISSIILLLAKEFTKWVLLANLVAWPIAWFAMNNWLQNFAYRINIGLWVFALAGGLALVIALLTVSTLAVRAALANPVESLRYE